MSPAKAKKAVAGPQEEAPKGSPCDFVYAGRCVTTGGKLGQRLYMLDPDGKSLGKECVFAHDSHKVLAGIYTGARFHDGGSIGLNLAKWTGKRYGDPSRWVEWEAGDEAAMIEYKAARLHADAKRMSEIEKLTEPLRKLLRAIHARGDWEAAEAVQQAIVRALRRPLKEDKR